MTPDGFTQHTAPTTAGRRIHYVRVCRFLVA
jgi:hypothetical protein